MTKFSKLICEYSKIKKSGHDNISLYRDLGRSAKNLHICKASNSNDDIFGDTPKQSETPPYFPGPFSWLDAIDEGDIARVEHGGTLPREEIIQKGKKKLGIDISDHILDVDDFSEILKTLIGMSAENIKREFENNSGRYPVNDLNYYSLILNNIRTTSSKTLYSNIGIIPYGAWGDLNKKISSEKSLDDFLSKMSHDDIIQLAREGKTYELGDKYLPKEDQDWHDEIMYKIGLTPEKIAEYKSYFNSDAIDTAKNKMAKRTDLTGREIGRTFDHFETTADGEPLFDKNGKWTPKKRIVTRDGYNKLANYIIKEQIKGWYKMHPFEHIDLDKLVGDEYYMSKYGLENLLANYNRIIPDEEGNDLKLTTPDDFYRHYANIGNHLRNGLIDIPPAEDNEELPDVLPQSTEGESPEKPETRESTLEDI